MGRSMRNEACKQAKHALRSLLRGEYGPVTYGMFSWQPVNNATKARTGHLKAGALAEDFQHIYDQPKGQQFPKA